MVGAAAGLSSSAEARVDKPPVAPMRVAFRCSFKDLRKNRETALSQP